MEAPKIAHPAWLLTSLGYQVLFQTMIDYATRMAPKARTVEACRITATTRWTPTTRLLRRITSPLSLTTTGDRPGVAAAATCAAAVAWR